MDSPIKHEVEELIAVIRESGEYREFLEAEKKVEETPGLADKVREFCWSNYELQNSDADDLSERVDEFTEKYREFRSNPVVSDYLERELRLCRLLQEINMEIMSVVELVI